MPASGRIPVSRGRNPYRRAGSWVTGAGWTTTPTDAVDEPPSAEPEAPGVGELAWGYTLADVTRIANAAAAKNAAFAAADFGELAWHAQAAVVDHLLDAETQPTRHDLAYTGKAAVWTAIREARQAHGYRNRDPWEGYGSAPRFATYWRPVGGEGHEDRVTDRLAVTQVLATLRDADRHVLLVAAAYDDPDDAAAATGRGLRTWLAALGRARLAAHTAWHAPETPAATGLRRLDRRRHRGQVAPCGTTAAARRHRSRRERLCEPCAAAERDYDRARKGRAP